MTDTLIKLRRSAVPGKIPTDSQLQLGEVAINTYDGKMFYKQSSTSNTILQVATTSLDLSQFATTTSAQLASVISNETGTGSLVFGTSPTLVTPVINGNTTFDSGTLFIDSVNNRVGIGTISPSEKLHVEGTTRSLSFASANGSAGSPAFDFAADPNTGMFLLAADTLGFATNGSPAAAFTPTGDLRLYNTTGNRYITISNQPTANVTLTIPVLTTNSNFVLSEGTATVNGAKTFSDLRISGPLTNTGDDSRDKLRVWSGSSSSIGMTPMSYGSLGFANGTGDYAMTFQMNNLGTRGFWWGDTTHTDAQGAMALTTDGKLTVANVVRVGYGESDTVNSNISGYKLDVNGDANLSGGIGVRAGTPTTGTAITSYYTTGHGNANRFGVDSRLTIDNTSGALAYDRRSYATYSTVETEVQNASEFNHLAYGVYGSARTTTAGGNATTAKGGLYGVYGVGALHSNHATYNNINTVIGVYGRSDSSGDTATIENAYGVFSHVRTTTTGSTINNGYLFYGLASALAGTFTNRYGLYIASDVNNYVNGGMQIGGNAAGGASAAGLGVNAAPNGVGNIIASGEITGSAFIAAKAGSATAPSFTFSTNTNVGMYVESGALKFATGGVEVGNFGTGGNMNLAKGLTTIGNIITTPSTVVDGASYVHGVTAGSRSMRIGVVKNASLSNPAAYSLWNTQNNTAVYMWFSDTQTLLKSTTGSNIGTGTGEVIGAQSSDERIKNIEPVFEYGMEHVRRLKPIAFTFIDDETKVRKLGFGAQTTMEIVPESVYSTGECIDGYEKVPNGDGEGTYVPKSDRIKQGMEYVQLIPVLTAALQEADRTIQTLAERIAALEERLN
jgi:hypothetical protein